MAATDDYIRGYLVGLELAKRLAGLYNPENDVDLVGEAEEEEEE